MILPTGFTHITFPHLYVLAINNFGPTGFTHITFPHLYVLKDGLLAPRGFQNSDSIARVFPASPYIDVPKFLLIMAGPDNAPDALKVYSIFRVKLPLKGLFN